MCQVRGGGEEEGGRVGDVPGEGRRGGGGRKVGDVPGEGGREGRGGGGEGRGCAR